MQEASPASPRSAFVEMVANGNLHRLLDGMLTSTMQHNATIKKIDFPYVVSGGGKGSYRWVVIADVADISEWSAKCGWPLGSAR